MAEWIRSHKRVLFDHSGGDHSWRGEVRPLKHSRTHRHPPIDDEQLMTLDECLDQLADTTERRYDIPWGSTEPGAAPTNLGDYLPQLLAIALGIRIVLLKAFGPPETVGQRDPFSGQLLVSAERELMVVQSASQNHWDAALPLGAALPHVSVVAGASRADLDPTALPTPTGQSSPSAAACTDTLASDDATSEHSVPSPKCGGQSVRRRIFANAPPDPETVQQLQSEQRAH
jgi:hypothetical protein